MAPIVLDVTAIVLKVADVVFDLESIVRAHGSPHPSILDLGAALDAIVSDGKLAYPSRNSKDVGDDTAWSRERCRRCSDVTLLFSKAYILSATVVHSPQ